MDSILSEEGGDDPVSARLLHEEYLAVALFIGATVLAGLQIILREFFNIGLPWSTETIVTMMIWSVYFGASGVTARRRHVRMDLLATSSPPRVGALVEIIASTCTLLYIAAIAVLAWRFLIFVFYSGELDPSTGLPGWFLVVGFPLGLTVAAYRAAGELRGRARNFVQIL
jgi:C4-dicarboxylate transporter DctQ subunit